MNKYITSKQATYALGLFIFAGNILTGALTSVKQDSWISMIMSIAIIFPVFLMYGRFMSLFPQMDLPEILDQLFGKVLSKVVISLFVIYFFSVCTLTVCTFTDFVQTIALIKTPHIVIATSLISVSAYMVYCGARTIGKWTRLMVPVVVFILLVTIVLSYNRYDVENILPIGEQSFSKLANGSLTVFSFPFGEAVIVLTLGSHIKGKRAPYKVLFGAFLVSFLMLFVIQLRNMLVLGPYISYAKYYTSYTAAGYISVGTFINRIEGSIMLNYNLSAIGKITLCIFALTKMNGSLFGLSNNKNIIMPISLLLLAFSMINFKNVMELFMFFEMYRYVALPFQIGLPLIIWIVAEIRMKIARKKAANAAA